MLQEGMEKHKFISEAQCLRDMQHKADSEYQAYLRRQEHKRGPAEKKQEQVGAQETNSERSRFPSGSSSKQSVGEEDLVAEPRLSAKTSLHKCDSRLPAIDQTSVKQKHKSTMTPKKPEKAGPSKPSSAAQGPQILTRKRKPNLGRLTVSPEMQSPRASGDQSRMKLQLPVRVSTLSGADPVAQQKGPLWTNDTKLKRPIRDRINFVPSSQLMTTAENISERTKKGVRRALSKTEPHSALPHAFQGPDSPQVLRESMGPPVTSCTMGGSRTAPFRVRDEDFYSILSLNSGGKNDDPEEETHLEEELVSVGMQSPCSPSRRKRSQSLGTLAPSFKNKTLEGDPENCRAISCRRSEFGHGSLNINNAVRSVTEQPSVGPKMFQDPRLRDGESAKETDSGGSANKKKSFYSGDTKFEPRQDDCLNAENVPNGRPFMAGRPSTHNYERDRQDFLNRSGNSSNCLLSGRPTALRSSVVNSSYNTPGLFVHSTVRDDTSIDLSMASSSVDNSDSEGNARFNNRRPLSPIRNRNPFTRAEHLSDFPVNSNCEFYVRGADNALTSQPQGAPSCSEDPLLNPQDSLFAVDSSSISPSEINRQDQLHVPMFLQENILLTSYAVSALPTRNVEDNLTAISVFPDEKEDAKIKTDPEKLKKLQESLLEEDSEEEGDLCRICQIAGGSLTNPLLEPCGCVGSLRFVHQECLKKWLQVKITSGADLGAVQTCEMCKQVLLVDLEDLNMNEFYRKSRQSRAYNELMNSSLYLVLLLHLYEQRFAELMRLNYNRVIRERLSRNYLQARPEENQNSALGDGNESSIYHSNGRVI